MKYISFSKKKKSISKIIIISGNGEIIVNNKKLKDYFGNIFNINLILIPIILSNLQNKKIIIKTKSGGKISQIHSIKIAISKCIILINYNNYNFFRKLNLFTVDDRKVERKKYGNIKSRKKEQYSKR